MVQHPTTTHLERVSCESRIPTRRPSRGIAAWWLLLGLFACGSPPTPADEVARSFWEAVAADDLEAAKGYVSRHSDPLSRASELPRNPRDILLGEVLKNERAAVVRTSMSTAEDEPPLKLSFETHLVLEDERWKVDLDATVEEVRRASVAAGMLLMSEIIGEGIHDLGEALQRGAGEVEEAIRDALEGSAGERI